MAKPAVIVVGADKGGVGKTTVSRTLLDYFAANNVATRAFDTESRATLKRFHPHVSEIVDMTSTADQMKIFDTLNGGAICREGPNCDICGAAITSFIRSLRPRGRGSIA